MKSKKCKECGKMINGWNKKVLDWNMKTHLAKHKRDNLSAENSDTINTYTFSSGLKTTTSDSGVSKSQEKGK